MTRKPKIAAHDVSEFRAHADLLKVCHLRFRAFESKFNRAPGLHDPLFFDESQSYPTQANQSAVQRQLVEATRAAGVKLNPILRLLNMSRVEMGVTKRARRVASRVKSHRSRNPRRFAALKTASSSWNGFLRDERLRRRHQITRDEIKALAGVSFLSEAQTEKDFLQVLKVIREQAH